MRKSFVWPFIGLLLSLALGFLPARIIPVQASDLSTTYTPSALISAVNALRAGHGLPAYETNSILMSVAQAQANYMASIGTWSDYGPGGSTLGERLLAAGYPLAGDLSAGGICSQNVAQGTSSMTVQTAINTEWSDAEHQIALFSTSMTQIGAGVTYSGGDVYYVIAAAQPTGSGQQQAYTPSSSGSQTGGTPVSQSQLIPMAIVSTPDQSGAVYHVVQPGQALWQIAIAYKVKINDIKNLNSLSSDVIFPGQKLLIMRVGTSTPVSPTAGPTLDLSTFTPLPTVEIFTETVTSTATATPVAPVQSQNGAPVVGGIIFVALAAAGFIAWASRNRPV